MLIDEDDIKILHNYLPIYQNYPYGERAPEFTGRDERVIEDCYNRWRGTTEHVIDCDECLEESFSRLMEQLLLQCE